MKSSLLVVAAVGAAAALWYATHLPGPLAGADGSGQAGQVSAKDKAARTAPPAVSVVKASVADFVETVLVTGSVVARDEIMIAPEIEGFRIVALNAEEGDRIEKGHVLASLSSDTLEAQLAQSDANIARAGAAIAVARSAIVQAEAAEKEAEQAFDRARPLRQSGTISESVFDQREAAAKSAKARLASARDSLKSAEADKTALEAARREIAWRKERAEIRSPVDGVVSRRTARIGAVASAVGEPLFRVIANGEIELDAEIAERDLGRIKDGQPAVVAITGVGEARGLVRLISSEVDRTTRIGKAKISLGVNPALRLGAFGRGSVETARSRGIGLPTSAVVFAGDGATVQVIADGKVETRSVTTGLATQTLIEIRKGIAEGDTVVAKSGSFLRDGDAVRPIMAPTNLSTATQ
ncbi:MAG: efflux RND transporter periplasmic adaptor subunit [Hyphomicrobiaceae bacterium]|nr:efflux RND transporter periplasmic adaptor subunit [Hyphomicrobiaceae bacterium]